MKILRDERGRFIKGTILTRRNSVNWKILQCLVCKKEFRKPLSRIRVGRGKYCSRKCANEDKKGFVPWNKGLTGKTIRNSGSFQKGHKTWNKGIPYMQDGNHPNWKGDKVGYNALHSWIQRKLGKPNKCDKCQTEKAKRFEWANISGEYMRNFNDWKRLCSKCHANEHKNWEVRWHVI